MAETETAPTQTADSRETPETSVVAADTPVAESHTSDAPEDLDTLVEKLKARAAEIPAEKLSFLDKKFQSAFTSRVNRLNNSVGNVARTVAETVKADLPADIDLFSPEGQKAFADAILKAQGEQLKPVLQHNEAQRNQAQLAANLEIAKRDSPIVAEHLKEIAPIFDSNPDLQTLAMQQDWAALPIVLEGIGYMVKTRKLEAELAQAKKLLEASSTTARTGKSTSRAGGHTPGGERVGKLKLADAIKEAEKQLQQGATQ